LDPFTVYRNAFAAQINLHIAAAIKRMSQKLFIDKPQKFQVVRPFGK
jgi:hypothetical protein